MFWKKKKKYKPVGRIGTYRVNDYPFFFTIAMEQICEVGSKSRVKVLEIGKACNKTDQECLHHARFQDWVETGAIIWETDAQYNERINRTEPLETEIFVEPEEPVIDYTQHTTNPFRHTFVENQPQQPRSNQLFGDEAEWEDNHMPF